MSKPALTLLFREYCSLCHAMAAHIEASQGRELFDLTIVDVDSIPELEARWGDLVPVLLDGEQELCHYHLNTAALSAYIAAIS